MYDKYDTNMNVICDVVLFQIAYTVILCTCGFHQIREVKM